MKILILGANSDVAYAFAKKMASIDHVDLYLASRNIKQLEKKTADLETRYNVDAQAVYFDALDDASHQSFYRELNPKPDGVVLAFGYLGDQTKAQNNFIEARTIIESNFIGAVSILEIIADDFEKNGYGFIVGISSVAGNRGRQSNYMYGAAKGALSIYLSGLRNRLSKSGVQVITVLPGFINTKMTQGLELPGFLTGSPDEIADDIYKAIQQKKDVIYTKWFWKWIMLIITSIPEKIFKRLNL